MKKIEKLITSMLITLECITLKLISDFTSPVTFISILISLIIIDIILLSIDS